MIGVKSAACLFAVCSTLAYGAQKFDIGGAYAYARDRSADIQVANLRLDTMINNVKLVEYRYYPDIAISFVPLNWRNLEQKNRAPAKLETTEPFGNVVLKNHLPTNSDITLRYSNSINSVGKRIEGYSARFDQELLKLDLVDKQMTLAIQRRELQRVARISVERNFLNSFRKTYYSYLEAKEGLDVIRAKSKEEEFLRDQSRRQYQAGIIAEYNLLDYMIDFNDSESERIIAESGYTQARNNLFGVMQLNFDDATEFETVSMDEAASMSWNLDEMMKAAITHSLDLATFRDAIMTSELNLRYLFDDWLPSIKAYASYENNTEENNYNSLVAESDNYTLGVQLTWSIFQETFATMGQYKNEKNTQRINELQLDDRMRNYKTRILNDVSQLERLYADYLISHERESLAKRDFDLSNDRMKTGTISAWDMIRTKNRYFAAIRRTIQRKYAFLRHVSDMLNVYPIDDALSLKYAKLSSREYFIEQSKKVDEQNKQKSEKPAAEEKTPERPTVALKPNYN